MILMRKQWKTNADLGEIMGTQVWKTQLLHLLCWPLMGWNSRMLLRVLCGIT